MLNEMSAHKEWASRPVDERYQSVQSLHDAALDRDRRSGSKVVDAMTLQTRAVGDDIAIVGKDDATIRMTNWSFGQVCSIAKAPVGFLSSISADSASRALNDRLKDTAKDRYQVYLGRDGGMPDPNGLTLRSLNGPDYARVHHSQVTRMMLNLMAENPDLALPMGYAGGDWGAPLVPSGAYLGDRGLFGMLINGNKSLDAPNNSEGLFRGVMFANSDVGARKLMVLAFLFERVCGNNIVWGFEKLAYFERRHVGDPNAILKAYDTAIVNVRRAMNTSAVSQQAMIDRANTVEIGKTRDEVIDAIVTYVGTETTAKAGYELAERFGENPRTPWGISHGLTRLSQIGQGYADARFDLDKAAADILSKFAG